MFAEMKLVTMQALRSVPVVDMQGMVETTTDFEHFIWNYAVPTCRYEPSSNFVLFWKPDVDRFFRMLLRSHEVKARKTIGLMLVTGEVLDPVSFISAQSTVEYVISLISDARARKDMMLSSLRRPAIDDDEVQNIMSHLFECDNSTITLTRICATKESWIDQAKNVIRTFSSDKCSRGILFRDEKTKILFAYVLAMTQISFTQQPDVLLCISGIWSLFRNERIKDQSTDCDTDKEM